MARSLESPWTGEQCSEIEGNLRKNSLLTYTLIAASTSFSFVALFSQPMLVFMDRPGVRQVPEGSGEQGKMEKIGCKIICGAPMTLAVKGLMMIMMNASVSFVALCSQPMLVSVLLHFVPSQC